MDAIITTPAVLTASSHAVETLRIAAEQAKALGKPEIIGSLIDVQVALMQVLGEQQTLLDKNHLLQERIRELEAALHGMKPLEFHHNAFWRRTGDGGLDGPYSTEQWNSAQRLVHLADIGKDDFDGILKVNFHDVFNNQNIFVPMSFLVLERVRPFCPSSNRIHKDTLAA